MKKLIILFIFAGLFASCESPVYKDYTTVSTLIWAKDHAYTFKPTIPDANKKYNMTIEIRHTAHFIYGELMVNVKMITPSGKEITTPYILKIREKDGDFTGEAMVDLVDTPTLVAENYSFPEAGEYTIEITHAADEDEIDDLMQIGLVISNVE